MSTKSTDEQAAGSPDSKAAPKGSVSRIKIFLVVALCLLGPIAGILVLQGSAPLYESEAKLLIRYVVDRSRVDDYENRQESGKIVMETEHAILTSRDLALEVAKKVGAERFAPGMPEGEAAEVAAADAIQGGLTVDLKPGSNVLVIRFRCRDAMLAVEVLQSLVNLYFEKHLEIHRPANEIDFVMQMADQQRTQLRQIEEELRKARQDSGTDDLTLRAIEERYERALEAYRKGQSILEKARFDHALDATRMPNISFVQKPSTAKKVRDEEIVTLAIILAVLGPVLAIVVALIPMGKRR